MRVLENGILNNINTYFVGRNTHEARGQSTVELPLDLLTSGQKQRQQDQQQQQQNTLLGRTAGGVRAQQPRVQEQDRRNGQVHVAEEAQE